jgi:hypothetical protein
MNLLLRKPTGTVSREVTFLSSFNPLQDSKSMPAWLVMAMVATESPGIGVMMG